MLPENIALLLQGFFFEYYDTIGIAQSTSTLE
jgi:hypothetical protein